ncbi:MAG: ABC transporter substrate-binding protein [Spirochaetia bacterium]
MASAAPILFLSTQLVPLPEAEKMRTAILKNFPQSVDFEPYDQRAVFDEKVIALAGSLGGSVVLGGLQEDFLRLYRMGALASVEGIVPEVSDRTFLPLMARRGRLGTDTAYFVPWMQATYLMAANKRALRFLPKGADLRHLSYNELLEWAAAMYQSTGKARLGFPVGPNGLMMRFLQGYLYPSFTGSMTDGFSSPQALGMWRYLRELWRYVAPSSLVTNRMDSALLNGEVWVAWDHTARLLQAFNEKPDDFIAFPGPAGPIGRGFISVVAGLGVPRGSLYASAGSLIGYLTRPPVQVETMESVGFLPVVQTGAATPVSRGVSSLLQAVEEQSSSADAIVSAVPIRAAAAARAFDLAYLVAFSRIVLRDKPAQDVLAEQQKVLRGAETSSLPEDRP